MPISPLKSAVTDVTPYQLFMLVLCIWALTILASDRIFGFSEPTKAILQYADNVVCLLFLADFAYNFVKAPNRWRYMRTWGWIDLLSSIPALDALRLGRFARLVRILKVLRAVKSARGVAHYVIAHRTESASLAAILSCLLILVFTSISVLQFEAPADGANIKTAEDAMWWAISTMTTVGYGDRFPITSEGRLLAVFLMATGVGAFGTLSGILAAWFLSPATKEADSDREEIKAMLMELTARLATTEGRSASDS
jgi:voltage-gated potassium channel